MVLNEQREVLARVSVWWTDTPPMDGERVGLLGHFFSADISAGKTVLQHAMESLRQQQCTKVIGPMDGNTWNKYRLVTETSTEQPFFLEPQNPAEWVTTFRESGFHPLAHYVSAIADNIKDRKADWEVMEKTLQEKSIDLSHLSLENFANTLAELYELSIAAFAKNFLYTPISQNQFFEQYGRMQQCIDPELVLLLYHSGKLIGLLFAIPDLNRPKYGMPLDTVIYKTLAVHPEYQGLGLGKYLMAKAESIAKEKGYQRIIHALMHQDNRSLKISYHNARIMRRYTLFHQDLACK